MAEFKTLLLFLILSIEFYFCVQILITEIQWDSWKQMFNHSSFWWITVLMNVTESFWIWVIWECKTEKETELSFECYSEKASDQSTWNFLNNLHCDYELLKLISFWKWFVMRTGKWWIRFKKRFCILLFQNWRKQERFDIDELRLSFTFCPAKRCFVPVKI